MKDSPPLTWRSGVVFKMSNLSEFKPVVAEPGRPLYQAVKLAIREAIDAGGFSPGDQLPSTKELSHQIDVSLVTVHRALQELVAGGVLRRGQGRGTFVHEQYVARAKPSSGTRLGLVFHEQASLADFYHGHVLEGVRRGAMDMGADLVVLHFGEDWRRECHGFIYVNPLRKQLNSMPWFGNTPVTVRRGKRQLPGRPPVMVVGASFEHDHVHSIDTDNADIAVQAVEHLASLGHTRIAYVGGGAEVCNNIDRWRGFRDAMDAAGLPVDERLVMRVPGWRLSDAAKLTLRSMLTASTRPTAVFGAGYYFALDCYAMAGELGMRIPDDLAIVGVDDPPSGEYLSPGLTTLSQPLEVMGRRAATGLLHLLTQDEQTRGTEFLKAELIVRGSTKK